MAQDVVVRMTAQDADLVAAWQRAKAGPDGVAREMEKLNAKTRASQQTFGSYAKSQIANWASIATGVGIATRGVTAFVDIQRKLREESASTTIALDEVFRKFQLQAGLTDKQGAAAREHLFGVAQRTATPVEQVSEVSRQLVSSGFAAKEVLEGGAGESFAQAMKASAAQGADIDPKELAQSVTQFILAQGREEDRALTKGNLERAIKQTQALFLKRNIQFADLTELAKAAPALSQANIDPTEQLTLFTKLRDVMSADESATALRNMVSRLQTAGAFKPKVEALKSMGLTPKDVDFQGEGMETILDRLAKGLKKLDQAEGAQALVKLFELRGQAGAKVLIEGRGELPGLRTQAEDTAQFERALKTSTEGPAAAKTRLAVQKQQKMFGDASDELMAMAIEAAGSKEEGARGAAEFRMARNMLVPQDVAFALSTSTFGEETEFAQEARRNLQNALNPDAAKQMDPVRAMMGRALERAGEFGLEKNQFGKVPFKWFREDEGDTFQDIVNRGRKPTEAAEEVINRRMTRAREQGETSTPEGKAMLDELRNVVRVLQEMGDTSQPVALANINPEPASPKPIAAFPLAPEAPPPRRALAEPVSPTDKTEGGPDRPKGRSPFGERREPGERRGRDREPARTEKPTERDDRLLEETKRTNALLEQLTAAASDTAKNTANPDAPARRSRRGQPTGPPLDGLR